MKRKRINKSNDTSTLFTLLLALLHKNNNNNNNNTVHLKLIKQFLNRLRFCLRTESPFCPSPFLALLPLLLTSKCAGIVRRSAEIVGLASLYSFEMNEQIAMDSEILRAMLLAFCSSNRRVLMALTAAVLDLCTTSVGRQRLLELSALERLMPLFAQVPLSLESSSLCIEDERDAASLKIASEDGLGISLIHTFITLVNMCNAEQLEETQNMLPENILAFLKKLWSKVRAQVFCGKELKPSHERGIVLSNIRVNDLAESIFRLSFNKCQFDALQPLSVKRMVFGCKEPHFENFIVSNWEVSPCIVTRQSSTSREEREIFSSLAQPFSCSESFPTFLSSLLQSSISCLPLASDELDLFNFLDEWRKYLGCPMTYQQDIRVLRTNKKSKREIHFFPESIGSQCDIPHIFQTKDIWACEEAYRDGYTIAIRGMEFRLGIVAAVADSLASLFGQPSVGANTYLTPTNSQGLACHYDDHCVFVFQLYGTKHWTTFPQSNLLLPHLYDPINTEYCQAIENSGAGTVEFLLKEGDILYIPRGCTHKASADDGDSFSLHLTFGIEVEPPFEWEGCAHVALCCWSQTKKENIDVLAESSSGVVAQMSLNLLHSMIELISISDPIFRKACLVAAISLPLDPNSWFHLNQKIMFTHLIDKIHSDSRFSEVLRKVEMAIEKNEDPFVHLKWLQVLYKEKETVRGHVWNSTLRETESLLRQCSRQIELAEASFKEIKSKFCNEVLLEDVIESYKVLLENYKRVRKQYMNGMLSLHCS